MKKRQDTQVEIEKKSEHIVKITLKLGNNTEKVSNIIFILIMILIFLKMFSNLEEIKVRNQKFKSIRTLNTSMKQSQNLV